MKNYFTINELLVKCSAQEKLNFLKNEKHVNNMLELVSLVNTIRERIGKPFIVHSCARDTGHNAFVGGSSTSQHLSWSAMDFHVDGLPAYEVYVRIKNMCLYPTVLKDAITVGQCICYKDKNFIHISIPYRKTNNFICK